MTSRTAPARLLALVAVAASLSSAPLLAAHPIEGLWVLNERASKNVPVALKGVDLKIGVRGFEVSIQKLVDSRADGDPLAIVVDGTPHNTEIGGRKASIEGRWVTEGKVLEQVIRMKSSATAGIPAIQKTVSTVSEDGQTLTRVQQTIQFGKSEERTLVYRRKS
jgi:hypothetical protein